MSLNGYTVPTAQAALDALTSHTFMTRCAVGDVSFRRWLIDLCAAEGMFFSHAQVSDSGQLIERIQETVTTAAPKGPALHVVGGNPNAGKARMPFVAATPDDDGPPPKRAA